ncbi:hypothetical protein OH76DRAFT_1359904 [Lentinus brumalis]|uniref:Uncharacterized protein n=1 Tax=Lentinus brumalis TaxID=2498619 RepID=A0A371CVF2_9APHY|nr:hypothetical protein OH76DRAFT_1359904 [Polyporus brumalis]
MYLQTLKVRRRVVSIHGLDQHKALLDKMKPRHMSGDEPEFEVSNDERVTHPRIFFIIDAFWQSGPLVKLLRSLDAWNVQDYCQSIGDNLPGGNPPRKRVELATPKVVNSRAPKGLWRNCYNDAWLDTLKPHEIRKLCIINKDYDFKLPDWSKATCSKEESETDEESDSDSDEE